MILQIYTDYHLPIHPAELSWDMMHYFYDPLIPGLIEMGKLRYKQKGK